LKEAFFETKRPLQVRQNNINNPSSTQFANDQTSVSTLKAEQNMSCIADIGITKGMQCNDTPKQRLRKRAFCLLLLAPIAFIFGSTVRAEFNIEPILQAYIASAFQKNTAVLKRFPECNNSGSKQLACHRCSEVVILSGNWLSRSSHPTQTCNCQKANWDQSDFTLHPELTR
jgi:hypothetical protein